MPGAVPDIFLSLNLPLTSKTFQYLAEEFFFLNKAESPLIVASFIHIALFHPDKVGTDSMNLSPLF